MEEFKTYKLEDITKGKGSYGIAASAVPYKDSLYTYLRITDIDNAGFLIKFSLDDKKANPRILKYYTHSKDYYDWGHSFDTGGTRGNINAKTYGTMPITLPSRLVQDKIVSILKSLDDKIELNRRIVVSI